MKKLFLFAAAIAATLSTQAQTEWGVKAGVDFGNYNISVDGLSSRANLGTKAGFYVGGVNNIWFSEKFGLQTELMYNYNGTRLAVSGDLATTIISSRIMADEETIKLDKLSAGVTFHTLRLPIMAKFRPADGLSVMAGPYLAMRIGTGLNLGSNTEDLLKQTEEDVDLIKKTGKNLIKDNTCSFDLGAALGVEYAFKCGFFVDLRYNVSFLNMMKKELDQSAIDSNADKINIKDELGVEPTIRYSAIQIGVGFRF